MFHDIQEQLNDHSNRKGFQGINFKHLLYADDTVIIAKSAKVATKILHLVEQESAYYDLALNKSKCNHISYNHSPTTRFRSGEILTKTEAAVYLGMQVNTKVDPRIEIQRRISSCTPVLKKA